VLRRRLAFDLIEEGELRAGDVLYLLGEGAGTLEVAGGWYKRMTR